MSFTPKALINAQYATAADATYYTVPASTHTIIDKMTVTNTDATDQTVWINLIPTGQSVGDSNLILKNWPVVAGETLNIDVVKNHILNAGDKISVQASAASLVVIRASGREVT